MAKFTPGPWTVEDRRQSTELTSILGPTGNRVAQWVAAHTDAPLIAAAPDLLADAQTTDQGWTWLAEQMRGLGHDARVMSAEQIRNFAKSLLAEIEARQIGTRHVIAKATPTEAA